MPWWPGADHSAWRKGPHRLTAQWALDLLLPPSAAELPAAELLQRLAGNGTLQVRDSQLAGLPLAADITLGYQPGGSAPATLKAETARRRQPADAGGPRRPHRRRPARPLAG